MLVTIAVILLILWLLGLATSFTLGGFIHILLVVVRVLSISMWYALFALLGAIVGLLIAVVVLVLVRKREADVIRTIEKVVEKTGGVGKAYIAGLPEDEANASKRILENDKDLKID